MDKGVLFRGESSVCEFGAFLNKYIRFSKENQLLKKDLWARFVNQYDEDGADADYGWRGEYWGKMMRGGCLVYANARDDELYEVLKASVIDMLDVLDRRGRLSTYPVEIEFNGWDMWCRKYVMLGMEYFMEISADETLNSRIRQALCSQADAIMDKVGVGKTPITQTSQMWLGANAASILEPFVKLYKITKESKYLDFATYIVESGGCDGGNLFELAYYGKLYPYQYPVVKAYEVTSCFEGLLEYYLVTGIERHKTAVINYAKLLLESDYTIIGSSGCTHELFDHSSVRQANTNNGPIAQETCVTVTIMKFFFRVFLLTGETCFADALETSFYNAYLGSFNTDLALGRGSINTADGVKAFEALPFDSYSPLTSNSRGNEVGGFKVMSDGHYYGCCACIGSAGLGVFAASALLETAGGVCLNNYFAGVLKARTPCGNTAEFKTETMYPADGDIKIEVTAGGDEEFAVMLRIPHWSKQTDLSINGKKITPEENFVKIIRKWKTGDVILLKLDMRTEAIYPAPYGCDMVNTKWEGGNTVPQYNKEDTLAKKHIALRRGPIILAEEKRLGCDPDIPVSINVNADGYVDTCAPKKCKAPYDNIEELCVPLTDGGFIHVTDYASAGKTLDEESKMAAWILTK